MTDKIKQYASINSQVQAIISGETDIVANMANISAILFNNLDKVNWVGFYFFKQGELVLGPFQGQPACIRIPMGKGVCGTSAANQQTVIVKDVHEFAGHIACDVASNSEIVVPIMHEGNLIGVLDVDSPVTGRFDNADKLGLEQLVALFTKTLTAAVAA